jgi:hypothetical protein
MRKIFSFFLLANCLWLTTFSQSVSIGNSSPDPSALLDIESSHKGLLIPRMTSSKRDLIASPAKGLMVFVTDDSSFYFYDGAWRRLTPADDVWSIKGNSGTDTSVHFIGTKDNNPVIFKVNNIPRLQLDGMGRLQLYSPNNNLFIGNKAGENNTTGSLNYFSGSWAGELNHGGNKNHFSGLYSGHGNTGGSENYFSGYRAGYNNGGGEFNHFEGFEAGYASSFTVNNYFSGYRAGTSNMGSNNHFTGYMAGANNTTGAGNHFSGNQSGLNNTTGFGNHFVGTEAGRNNTTGNLNHFDGAIAGYSTTTGNNNYFSGRNAGFNNVTGSNNTLVGYNADVLNSNLTNAGAIGYNAKALQSNTFIIGGTGPDAVNVGIGLMSPVSRLHVNGTITATAPLNVISDAKYKTNITPLQHATSIILQLRGVSYDWRRIDFPEMNFPADNQIGFIAQEVEKLIPQIITTDSQGNKSISYTSVIPLLVEAIKEQQNQIEDLKLQVEKLIRSKL